MSMCMSNQLLSMQYEQEGPQEGPGDGDCAQEAPRGQQVCRPRHRGCQPGGHQQEEGREA